METFNFKMFYFLNDPSTFLTYWKHGTAAANSAKSVTKPQSNVFIFKCSKKKTRKTHENFHIYSAWLPFYFVSFGSKFYDSNWWLIFWLKIIPKFTIFIICFELCDPFLTHIYVFWYIEILLSIITINNYY